MDVVTALREFSKKSKNDKKAQSYLEMSLLKKGICTLRQAVIIGQNYKTQKQISSEIYNQKLI
jgi:hypothetical protein